MNLRNRIAQLFNNPKSAEKPSVSSSATSEITARNQAENLNPTFSTSDAPNWGILREDTGSPEITFDDLAKVRFSGDDTSPQPNPASTSINNIPALVETSGDEAISSLEAANGGGSLLGESEPSSDVLISETSIINTLAVAEPAETQEAEPISPELKAFKNFFNTDMRIKRELLDAVPKPADDYDEASRMDYVEAAYRTFRDFKHDFLGIARDFRLGGAIQQNTEDFFQRGQENFAIGDYSAGITKDLYQKAFTDMRPDFIEEVKSICVGYTDGGGFNRLVLDASTINELLHAYHSYIMNSDDILQSVPALAKKENSGGYPITLRGDHSALGQQVFDAIPDDLDVGWTDIVSVDEHVMMMVRDRGHALTIRGEPDAKDHSKIWVNYNIPKICNEAMIKALPGLAGYTQHGARGGFVVSSDDFGSAVADFISKVPMDSDMPPYRPDNA